MFYVKKIKYNYEEYLEHLKDTIEFSKKEKIIMLLLMTVKYSIISI